MIVAQNLTASYGLGREPVLNIDALTIRKGEIVAFYGRNHAGKSTLLKILAGSRRGIHLSQDCSVLYNGQAIDEFEQRNISYLPQNFSETLFPWLSLRKNLRLRMLACNEPSGKIEEAVEKLCSSLGYSSEDDLCGFFGFIDQDGRDKRPNNLSGGQKQTLALLRSLIPIPSVLILDEPFSAIDFYKGPILRRKLIDHIHDAKTTTVVVSHSLEKSVDLADRIYVVERTKNGTEIQNEYKVRDFENRKPLTEADEAALIRKIKTENEISE